MIHRMVSATLAMAGFFVALYLWLWKIGFLGVMACGTGSCETVQLSSHAMLFGQPVALYGVGGYLALFAVSVWGLHGRWAAERAPTVWLAVLSGVGVAFTAYLSYLEAFVIDAWCRWCLVSAGIIVGIFVTAVIGLRAGGVGQGRPASEGVGQSGPESDGVGQGGPESDGVGQSGPEAAGV